MVFPIPCLSNFLSNSRTDYDPEADGPASEDDSGSDVSEDENAGTEHYESVGKSKLRKKEELSLGPQYRGSKVSRAALDQDSDEEEDDEEDEDDESEGDYADPDLIDLEADEAEASDSEIESDDALAESDAGWTKDFAFRGSSKPVKPKGSRAKAADYMTSSGEENEGRIGADGNEEEESEEDDDMDDGLDDLVDSLGELEEDDEEDISGEDDDEDDEDDESESDDDEFKKKAAAPGLLSKVTKVTTDIEKGMAIQQQRKMYDGLLNLRIRLQKALIAANTFPTLKDDESEPASEPYEAAEEAAIKLLNTISNLKEDFGTGARVGSKRKRTLEISDCSEKIWEQLQDEEHAFTKFRQDSLEKWSRKVQSVTVTAASGLGQKSKTLINTLEEQLTNSDNRLVKRTHVPRSCAPAQAAKCIAEDENIYDDADFYQQLLKELVDQRTLDSSGEQTSAVPSVMLTAAKDAKMRKSVDRKASKGRKMRFTVHEKLQNFMAPEDRRTWEQGAIDRFFMTLFGQKVEMGEDESEDEEMVELKAQADGLRLFR